MILVAMVPTRNLICSPKHKSYKSSLRQHDAGGVRAVLPQQPEVVADLSGVVPVVQQLRGWDRAKSVSRELCQDQKMAIKGGALGVSGGPA